MEDQLQREYYQDIGYRPFLFYMIFGASGDELEVSRKKHKVDEFPKGLDIRTLTRKEHGSYIDGFLSGDMGKLLKEADEKLYESCRAAPKCAVLQGRVEDDSSLKYMKNVIGFIQAFIDQGAAGILDPQTISLYSPEKWTEKFFGREINAQNHVVIISSEESGNFWLHTRGMAEFGRPDIGIYDVPEDKVHDCEQIINQMIYYGGKGLFFERKAKLHTSDGKAFVIQPEFVNDFENFDYNNAYYRVTVLEEGRE